MCTDKWSTQHEALTSVVWEGLFLLVRMLYNKDGILAEFLVSYRAEVRDMCITEYNEKSFVNGIRAEESERIAMKMLKKNKYSYEEIADNCDLTIEQVKDLEAEILQLQ